MILITYELTQFNIRLMTTK